MVPRSTLHQPRIWWLSDIRFHLLFRPIGDAYQPKTIVFYAGDNDISKGKSAKIVSEDFRKFAKLTTQALPQTQILFVAIKPSIKRWNLMNKMRVANQMIADFAKSKPQDHQGNGIPKGIQKEYPSTGQRPRQEIETRCRGYRERHGYV